MFTKYDKFLIGVLGAIAQVVQASFGNNHYVQVAVAVLTAAGVYATPNKSA